MLNTMYRFLKWGLASGVGILLALLPFRKKRQEPSQCESRPSLEHMTAKRLCTLAAACKSCYDAMPITSGDASKTPRTIKTPTGRADVYPCGVICDRYIVVAVEGTDELADWLTNLDAVVVRDPLSGRSYHRGFRDHASALWNTGLGVALHLEAQSAADQLDGIVITGHSMGGAVAEILTDYAQQALPGVGKLSCVTFGAPRARANDWWLSITEAAALTPQGAHPTTLRVVHELDVVPQVPTAWRFAHSNTCMWLSRDGHLLNRDWMQYMRLLSAAFWTPKVQLVDDHSIDNYIAALRDSKTLEVSLSKLVNMTDN